MRFIVTTKIDKKPVSVRSMIYDRFFPNGQIGKNRLNTPRIRDCYITFNLDTAKNWDKLDHIQKKTTIVR